MPMYDINQPLKRPVAYGVYPWWPENGTEWIHPHDVPKAQELIPSDRVLRRSELDRDFSTLQYGKLTVRVRATMWLPIDHEGFDIDDTVEVCSRMGKNEPFVGIIEEMFWNDREKKIEYQVSRNHRPIARRFSAIDLQHVHSLESPATQSLPLQRYKMPGNL